MSMRAADDGGNCPGPYRDDNEYVTGAQISGSRAEEMLKETAEEMLKEADSEYDQTEN
jgi:hypothetical protein